MESKTEELRAEAVSAIQRLRRRPAAEPEAEPAQPKAAPAAPAASSPAPAPAASSSVERCLNLIRDIRVSLSDAKHAFISGDNCVVNRAELLGKLRKLEDSLPSAFTTASQYVKEIDSIRKQTEQESTTRLRDSEYKARQATEAAEQQARQTIEAAEQQAQQTLAKAQAEAEAMVTAARQQAQSALQQAQAEAEAMKNRENVLRMARVEASELRETTQREMTVLRQNTFDYLDTLMEHADCGLSDLIASLRQQRSDLNQHR